MAGEGLGRVDLLRVIATALGTPHAR